MNAFVSRMEPEVWRYVDAILQLVPDDVDVSSYRSDAELIDALGRAGAFDALRAYQEALQRYYAGIVFWAIRTATLRPIADGKRDQTDEPYDFAEPIEVPWCSG